MGIKENIFKFFGQKSQTVELSANSKNNVSSKQTLNTGLVNQIAQKSLSRVRQDVGSWNTALTMARKAEKPKRHLLYNLYDEISIDGLLRSQLSNRFLKSLASSFTISDKNGKVNDEITALLQDKIWAERRRAKLKSKTN